MIGTLFISCLSVWCHLSRCEIGFALYGRGLCPLPFKIYIANSFMWEVPSVYHYCCRLYTDICGDILKTIITVFFSHVIHCFDAPHHFYNFNNLIILFESHNFVSVLVFLHHLLWKPF